jgi:hypothetical protein
MKPDHEKKNPELGRRDFIKAVAAAAIAPSTPSGVTPQLTATAPHAVAENVVCGIPLSQINQLINALFNLEAVITEDDFHEYYTADPNFTPEAVIIDSTIRNLGTALEFLELTEELSPLFAEHPDFNPSTFFSLIQSPEACERLVEEYAASLNVDASDPDSFPNKLIDAYRAYLKRVNFIASRCPELANARSHNELPLAARKIAIQAISTNGMLPEEMRDVITEKINRYFQPKEIETLQSFISGLSPQEIDPSLRLQFQQICTDARFKHYAITGHEPDYELLNPVFLDVNRKGKGSSKPTKNCTDPHPRGRIHSPVAMTLQSTPK